MPTTVEKNPLISLYRSLDSSDGRRLGKWHDSPAHNQREDVRRLHAYLLGGKDRLYKTSALTKTRIWQHLFPDEPFDDARLRQTFHWALRSTEAFVAYLHWAGDEFDQQLALATALRHRNVPTAAGRSLKRAGQLHERTRVRNEAYYRRQYELEIERDEYRTAYRPLDAPHFQAISDTLDLTYYIEKLKASWNMLYHQRIYKTNFELRFLDEVVQQVRTLDLNQHPVLAIHYYGYLGLVDDDASGRTVSRLRNAVRDNGHLLSPSDLRYVILMAINLCINNVNQGREPFVREAFEWYRLAVAEDVLAADGILTRATYLNVVTNAIKLGEFDWVVGFVNDFSPRLEEEIRANTERFARARIAYEQGDYATSMPLLVQVDFKHPVYNLMAKTLQLKIYYELEEFDALDSQLGSMTTYLRRKQMSDLYRENFGNLVRFVRQLSRLPPGDATKREDLRRRVTDATPLSEKKWLLERFSA